MDKRKTFWRQIPAMKFILLGYVFIILVGAVLLALPVATRGNGGTPFSDCVFTATSATCVTGLIRYDTMTHWTLFGQLVILILIQIGGVGFMTVALLVMMIAKKRISLAQRSLMQDSISAPELGGIVPMTKFILSGTFLVEAVGAIMLAVYYVPIYGPARGSYMSIFHSISAFCNGGFDLMGDITGPCSSMVGVEKQVYVNVVLMGLIFVAGLGFYVWKDLLDKRLDFRKLRVQSKIVLSVSLFLVFFGAAALLATEYGGPMYQGYSLKEKIVSCLFQSVSARTAGFNTADLSLMSEAGRFIMICLMLVGGSTGSTAGGMKTTTLYVLVASVKATILRKQNIEAFGRRLDEDVTRTASCIFMTYLGLIVSSTVIITAIEKLPLLTVLFETTSAMATVGITLGITGSLGMTSKWIIAFLMLCGRVGSVTMLLAFSPDKSWNKSRLPMDHIQIG